MEQKKSKMGITYIFALFLTITSIFISGYGYKEGLIANIFLEARIILFNYILILLFILALKYIFKSLSMSFIVSSLIINIGAYVNYVKILYRQEPLLARDLGLIREAATMSQKYDMNFKSVNGILLIASIILTILIVFSIRNYEFNYKHRIIKAVVVLTLLIGFSETLASDYNIYHKLGAKSGLNMWLEMDSYQSKGFVYPFFYSIKQSRPYKYEDFNKNEAEAVFNKYSDKEIAEDKKINFVIVMLESFKDFSKLENEKFKFERDPYEYFHSLQAESVSGRLLVNSFGGGTFLTETNVLTGYKNNPPFNRKTKSYVRYFKENGYNTYAFHPYVGSFYNRNNVYPRIGFDEFFEQERTFKDMGDYPINDNQLYPIMMEKWNDLKNEPRLFFAVTYQNHGPYPDDRLIYEEPILEWRDDYDLNSYNYFNNYMGGIEQASNSLKILRDNLQNSSEPTVLIVFGDHSPSMGENNKIFDMLGINHDLKTSQGIVNTYETPYIIWANNACENMLGKKIIGEGRDMEPAFLMNEVFSYLGYEGPAYCQYQNEVKEELTVIKNSFFKSKGEFTENLDDNAKKKLKEFKNVEYYVSHMLDKEKE